MNYVDFKQNYWCQEIQYFLHHTRRTSLGTYVMMSETPAFQAASLHISRMVRTSPSRYEVLLPFWNIMIDNDWILLQVYMQTFSDLLHQSGEFTEHMRTDTKSCNIEFGACKSVFNLLDIDTCWAFDCKIRRRDFWERTFQSLGYLHPTLDPSYPPANFWRVRLLAWVWTKNYWLDQKRRATDQDIFFTCFITGNYKSS